MTNPNKEAAMLLFEYAQRFYDGFDFDDAARMREIMIGMQEHSGDGKLHPGAFFVAMDQAYCERREGVERRFTMKDFAS